MTSRVFHRDARRAPPVAVRGEGVYLFDAAMGGTIDGRRGDHVLLAPPFIAEETRLDEAVEILGAAVDAAVETATAVTPR